MKRFLKYFILFLTILPCLNQPVAAQITVNQAVFHFRPGAKPYQNVQVVNHSNEVLHVNVEATEMINPGATDEQRVPSEDLIISPRRFSIEAKGSRTVRILIARSPSDKESVFRARLLPQSKKPGGAEKKLGRVSTRIKVLTGAGILLFQHPLESIAKLDWERSRTDVVFTNSGNRNVLLYDGESCIGSKCQAITAMRLHPGNVWSVKAGPRTTLKFKKEVGDSTEDLIIEAE